MEAEQAVRKAKKKVLKESLSYGASKMPENLEGDTAEMIKTSNSG